MARKFYSDWLIQDDEFHPDPRHAAKYADAASRIAALNYTKDSIRRYEARGELTALDQAGLALMRSNLARIEQDIEDAKEDDE